MLSGKPNPFMKSQDRNVVRMRHMLDAATKAVSFVADKSRNDLDTDEMLALALVRLIEIIGEAASKVSAETQNRSPMIEWRDIIGTRNRLIHAYEAVNFDILWQIASVDLPQLIPKLQQAIDHESKGDQGKLF